MLTTGFLIVQILFSFCIFTLSARENRDMISLSIIMILCQRGVILPLVIYLTYQTVSEELILTKSYKDNKQLNKWMYIVCVSYIYILAQVVVELMMTALVMTCAYVCKKGTQTIGHD